MKKIILTGGGTAGHVMPHLALLPYLRENDYHVDYIGSKNGIEKKIIEKEGLPYYGIASGKLRRYFDLKNFTDLFKIFFGTLESIFLMRKLKPSMVFSKGGFVTVPVVIAAWLNKVPVVIHESDMTPGLANKIASKFAVKICTTFESTLSYIPATKSTHTGAPIRGELLIGNKQMGHAYTHLDHNKAILMVTGGSLGAQSINDCLRNSLLELTKTFHVVHLCGKGNIDHSYDHLEGYRQYEFVGKHMADIYAMADVVVSRAGSNTITELVALKKPHLLIPLPAAQSRGDQLLNADAFEALGYSMVLQQEHLTPKTLVKSIHYLYQHPNVFVDKMAKYAFADGTRHILNVIESLVTHKI
ncbi:undecaprenyldiphospho-muramoylpentapeptide beta-N-acetylglucosaminyltransferase [Petrocella sp. FN5]|uniref:undecaprenyldiphospho-muramoylpentapeptide beta-N-acetylglucosaminyltransferase n=1 Tax=Petrocella sp. FN5 TaxID=3032002 RepID=UPI0023D97CE3|nr:undecaprenyldiphospho-muramoylpentapeptide beta-N-acetylglucosaminyltransferase [Petrocella sp. FN5]MDF1618006.1 undecaprenyldiphospho-muramoylpentapeptide beta-N-acetylglucosaminyltransferase [Petrocella sp. FN5]